MRSDCNSIHLLLIKDATSIENKAISIDTLHFDKITDLCVQSYLILFDNIEVKTIIASCIFRIRQL